MNWVTVDASDWVEPVDVIVGIYDALRVPGGGTSVDAAIDRLIYDDVPEIERPCTLLVKNIEVAQSQAAAYARLLQTYIEIARKERIDFYGVDAQFHIQFYAERTHAALDCFRASGLAMTNDDRVGESKFLPCRRSVDDDTP